MGRPIIQNAWHICSTYRAVSMGTDKGNWVIKRHFLQPVQNKQNIQVIHSRFKGTCESWENISGWGGKITLFQLSRDMRPVAGMLHMMTNWTASHQELIKTYQAQP